MGRPVGTVSFPFKPDHWSGGWRQKALCLEHDYRLWFSVEYHPIQRAKTICSACPVSGECLEYALDTHPDYGIFGGETPSGRRRILRERKRKR